MSHLNKLATALAVLALSTGCGRLEEADGADDADESASVTSAESALTADLSDEVSQPMSATSEALATGAAKRIGDRLKASGCAVVTQTGNTVTYALTNCTGPYGLVNVTGTVTAVYTRANSGGVQVVITGSGIKANNSTISLNATVISTEANGIRTAVVTANGSGTGPRGAAVGRVGNYTTTYDQANECITINGSWETSGAQNKASTVVSNYKRCKGTCPAAGGSIVHTFAGSRGAVTLTYDGSAVAKWAGNNRSGTLNLKCGQ